MTLKMALALIKQCEGLDTAGIMVARCHQRAADDSPVRGRLGLAVIGRQTYREREMSETMARAQVARTRTHVAQVSDRDILVSRTC